MNITRILTCFKSFSRALAKDRVDAKGDAGADPENPERMAGILVSYIDTFYVSEHFIKIIQNFKEKGVTAVPSASP